MPTSGSRRACRDLRRDRVGPRGRPCGPLGRGLDPRTPRHAWSPPSCPGGWTPHYPGFLSVLPDVPRVPRVPRNPGSRPTTFLSTRCADGRRPRPVVSRAVRHRVRRGDPTRHLHNRDREAPTRRTARCGNPSRGRGDFDGARRTNARIRVDAARARQADLHFHRESDFPGESDAYRPGGDATWVPRTAEAR